MTESPRNNKSKPEQDLGDVHFSSEIDPYSGYAHNSTILPASPLPDEPPPPKRRTFLQEHPYLGPIIAAIITAIVSVILFWFGKK